VCSRCADGNRKRAGEVPLRGRRRATRVVGFALHQRGRWAAFSFTDSNPPTAGLQYRVCVSKRSLVVQCWNRRVAAYRSHDGFGVGNFATPQYGELVARWYVGGRAVARWNFYYAPGD
jgi:hypothetical protein